ncbi:MAG: hypothetical protein PHE17_12330 [Thiothrix sp.]|uniref:hypothetical protein n=1 Tax=Thiothrix sp. TaxID=1032 RepID=UPI0026340495|nr:hypothetical protein [Thiothrix sp.]MDD5393797.1 hypothetical protein [Thiothrix sp.]
MEEIIGLMVALSVAAERLVEITKGVVPFLAIAREEPRQEKLRKSALQVLALASGIVVTFLAEPMLATTLPATWHSTTGLVVIGLMASGGSGFWNVILSYLLQVKDIKRQTLQQLQMANTRPELPSAEIATLRPVKSVQDIAA